MSKPNQDARQSVTISESVTMDSRKFLSVFNNSAESQIKFFKESVEKLGAQNGSNWRLAATTNGRIFIEDVDTGEYLVADYSRQKGGRITVNNVRKVAVTEGEKNQHFEAAVTDLVESIQKNDPKALEGAYGRIVASRFRSKAVPNSGLVRTGDGVVRHVSVRADVMSEEVQDALVTTIVEELSDQVTITEGGISGTFSREPFRLPVSPLMERRVVAWHARESARNAYWHASFQTLVESVAGQICNGTDGVRKAIPAVASYLQEQQEFNLLTRNQMEEVVGNALAAKGVFNETLAKDTATLLYKTGLKVNRADIVNAWRLTAKKADHPVMLENVSELEKASEADFGPIHDRFLNEVFMSEAVGETTRQGLANGLSMLKDKISDPNAQQQIDELASKLQNPSTADDQSVWDAMNLMAKTNQRMTAMENFDQMPGADALGAEEGGAPGVDAALGGETPPVPEVPAAPAPATGGAQTIININTGGGGAPQISNTPPAPEAGPPSDDLAGALDDINLEGGGEDQNDQGQGGTPPPPPDDQQPPLMQGLERDGIPLNEDDQGLLDQAMSWLDENVDGASAAPDEADNAAVAEGVDALLNTISGAKIDPDYGVKVLKEYVLNQRVADVDKLVKQKNLKPDDLNEHLDELAGAALAGDQSLKDPKMMQKAKEELVGAYTTRQANAKRQAAGGSTGTPPVVENQYRSPLTQLARRGLKKAAVNKLVTENKLQWIKREGKAVLGQYKGIAFVIEREQDPAVLLNHDGSVEIPIPEGMVPGALYLSEMTDTAADADPFVEWLDSNIEQLRPLTESEEKLVSEAVAKLTVSPGTKVEIEVDAGLGDGELGAAATPVIIEPDPVPTDGGMPPELTDGEGGEESPVDDLPSGEDGEGIPAEEPGNEDELGDESGEPTEPGDESDDENLEEALQRVMQSGTLNEDGSKDEEDCEECKKKPCICKK